MRMLQAIPALPVRDISQSVDYYRDKLGFATVHQVEGFAVLQYDAVKINLWAASDEDWRMRSNSTPVVSGSESFIAGSASCRIEVEGLDDFYIRMESLGILHPNSKLKDQWWGERDFGVTDPDKNLITYFERVNAT